jgi:hypothetical protein
MKKPKVVLALPILILMVAMGEVFLASSNVDIDYSHNVVGTGTVFTDFKMGSMQNTEAIGRVRGTGEVMNKYLFQSNASENVTIEDQFLLTSTPIANETPMGDFPQMAENPGGFRMLGTAWADEININSPKRGSNQSRSS